MGFFGSSAVKNPLAMEMMWVQSLGWEGAPGKETLQYSCLENSMDRGGWQATVHIDASVGHYFTTAAAAAAKSTTNGITRVSLIYSVWETMCVPFITPLAPPPSSNVLYFLAKSHSFISTPEVDNGHQQSSLLSWETVTIALPSFDLTHVCCKLSRKQNLPRA